MSTTLDYRDIRPGRMYLAGGGRSFGAAFHGVNPDETKTSAQMLVDAGLDWQVDQRAISYRSESGTMVPIDGKVANVRSDTGLALGVVGAGYTPLQNADGFAFADELVQGGDGAWIGAAERFGGAQVQAFMRLDRDIRIGGLDDEKLLPLLAFKNGHDGGTGVAISVAPFRAACLNGMMLPIKGEQRVWRYRHTVGLRKQITAARETLSLAWSYYDELEVLGNQLLGKPMAKRELNTFLGRLIPLTPKMEEQPDSRPAKNRDEAITAIAALAANSENLENVRWTRWAALQAVGEYSDWHRPARTTKLSTGDENRLTRATQPIGLKDRAVELLTH